VGAFSLPMNFVEVDMEIKIGLAKKGASTNLFALSRNVRDTLSSTLLNTHSFI